MPIYLKQYFFKLLQFICLLLFILAPRINLGIPIHGGMIALFISILISQKSFLRLFFTNLFIKFSFILIILLIYNFLLAKFYKHDASFVTSIILSLISYSIFCYTFLSRFFSKYDYFDLIQWICLIFFINSLIIVFEFYSTDFKSFIESLLVADSNSNIDYADHAFRFRGIASSGGASLSVANALVVWLIICSVKSEKISVFYAFVMIIIICASNIFTGRTGLGISLFLLLYFFLFKYIPSMVVNSKFHLVRDISFCFLIYWVLPPIEISDEVLNWAFEWSTIFQGKELDTASTDELKDMLILPTNPPNLLFGVGFFEGTSYLFQRTDSGYLKTLYSFGLIITIVIYFLLIKFYCNGISVDSRLKWCLFPILGILMFTEVKEPFLYQNFTPRILFFFGMGSLFINQICLKHE